MTKTCQAVISHEHTAAINNPDISLRASRDAALPACPQ